MLESCSASSRSLSVKEERLHGMQANTSLQGIRRMWKAHCHQIRDPPLGIGGPTIFTTRSMTSQRRDREPAASPLLIAMRGRRAPPIFTAGNPSRPTCLCCTSHQSHRWDWMPLPCRSNSGRHYVTFHSVLPERQSHSVYLKSQKSSYVNPS